MTGSGTTYLPVVMICLIILAGVCSGKKSDEVFREAVRRMSGGLSLFILFLLFGPMFDVMTGMGAFTPLAELFAGIVSVIGTGTGALSQAIVMIMGSLVGGFGIEGASVVQMQITNQLFAPILEVAGMPMKADLTMANLESTVYSGGPIGRNSTPEMPAKMNTSREMLEKFTEGGAGIGYFSMANNHCYDYGKEGLLETLDRVEETGAWHSGTNRTPEEQERADVFERNGIRMAMLSYTCDLNGSSCKEP